MRYPPLPMATTSSISWGRLGGRRVGVVGGWGGVDGHDGIGGLHEEERRLAAAEAHFLGMLCIVAAHAVNAVHGKAVVAAHHGQADHGRGRKHIAHVGLSFFGLAAHRGRRMKGRRVKAGAGRHGSPWFGSVPWALCCGATLAPTARTDCTDLAALILRRACHTPCSCTTTFAPRPRFACALRCRSRAWATTTARCTCSRASTRRRTTPAAAAMRWCPHW